MLRRSFLSAVLCGLVLSSFVLLVESAVAEEPKSGALLQTLPADGVWATFDVNVKLNGQEFVLAVTARSVGQAFQFGKQCRILELEQTNDNPPSDSIPQLGNLTWRLIVPEDAFGEGKDPLSRAGKIWLRIDKQEPEVVESVELKDPFYATLFQGPKSHLKAEEAKEKITWQRGDLECSVISGENESEFGIVKLTVTHRIFRHRDVPFGIAGLQQELKASIGGQEQKAVIRVSLRDHGKDAKPKLPDLLP